MRQAFILLLVALVMVVSRPAFAEPKTAAEWFNVGDNQYNLGNFDKAIEAFRKAFEIEKDEALKPIYLYNIAQAYRQAGDCDNAVFFYKRFLSLKATDAKKPLGQSTKDDIQKRIAEQEKICADKKSQRDKPPEGTMRPEEGEKGQSGEGQNGGGGDGGEKVKPEGEKKPAQVATVDTEDTEDSDPELRAYLGDQPQIITLRAGAGLGVPRMDPVNVANQFSATLIAGYPILLAPKVGLDVGAAFSLSPLQWDNNAGESQTSLFIAAVVNAGLRAEVMPKLLLRADVGVGALFLTNVAEGNPFTMSGKAADGGALTMFHLRTGASVEYSVASSVSLWASPFTLGYSPSKAGLLPDSIIQISFLAGLGYRL